MNYRIVSVLLLMLLSIPVIAGEQPSFHFTGNPHIDFFSKPPGLTAEQQFAVDSLSPTEVRMSEHKEKSPWIAGALSLAIPGAGEVYSESYVKGAAFFAVEAASWITAIIYHNKGDQQTVLFQNYANAHWSASRYALWLKSHLDQISPGTNVHWNDYTVFPNPLDTVCSPPFPCVNWSELNRLEQQGLGFGHGLPYWNDQQYYELIGKYYQFSKGWDSQYINGSWDETDYHLGNKQFDNYRNMFNQADIYYDVWNKFISVIIANHILSTLDAIWSATRYNNSLHADVKIRMIPTQSGLSPMTEANIQFSF